MEEDDGGSNKVTTGCPVKPFFFVVIVRFDVAGILSSFSTSSPLQLISLSSLTSSSLLSSMLLSEIE